MVAITRVDYANLFHTIRDVFNIHHALMTGGYIDETTTAADVQARFKVVFLDGHAKVLTRFKYSLHFHKLYWPCWALVARRFFSLSLHCSFPKFLMSGCHG